MIRENRTLIFDTETKGVDGKFVYDLGYIITNRRGDEFCRRRFLVREVITNPDIMRDAYYNRKIYTCYIPMLDSASEPMVMNWEDIGLTIRRDIARYNVNILSAYNLPFDLAAMRETSQLVGLQTSILAFKPTLLCLWLFACQHLFTRPTYKTMARREGWLSDAGNYRTTAEHAYRYLTCQYDYEEPHTALEDAEIEKVIFTRLLAMRKTIPYNELNAMPWRIPQDD